MMLRQKMVLAAAALAVACFLSAPVRAGDAMKMVPADALGLVVVDGLEALDTKVGKALESLQLPLPGPLTALQAVPGLSDCLDQESPIVVAVLKGAEAGDDPALVAFVPVKDFEAFTELFGGEEAGDFIRLTVPANPLLVAEKDGFAIVVEEDSQQRLAGVLESPGGLAEKLGDDLAWIDQRDVAAVMTDAGISVFCEKALEGISVAQEAIRAKGEDEVGAAEILNVYRSMFAVMDQEVELVGIGLDLQETGDLALQVRKRFLPAGQFAQCVTDLPPSSDVLSGLPAVPFVVAGGAQFTPAMGQLMMDYSVEVMRAAPKLYGISDEQADGMLELAAPLMKEMQSFAMMLAVGSPDDTIYSRMVGVMKSEDAKKYMEAYEKYMKDFSELMKGSKGMFSMAMGFKPVEISGCHGLQISMELPMEILARDPNADVILEKMIGPGGKVRVFIVAADDHHVLIGYTNKKLVRKAIASLKKGESICQEASVAQAAEKLPAGNVGQGYFSPTGLVQFINDMVGAIAPEEQKFQLPAFPATPPVAWTANAEGATVDAQVIVPSDMIKAGILYAGQVRKAFEPSEE